MHQYLPASVEEEPPVGRTVQNSTSIEGPAAWYLPLKFSVEWILGLILLAISAPIILLIALLMKLTSGGSVFYSQTRLGLHGSLYVIYKIRTMIPHSEAETGPIWSGPDDPRVTRLGRLLRMTHLDELPQFFNVVRGNMSLIGPRPERPELVPELEERLPLYRQRLRVRPGLTGLAQIHLLSDRNIESVRRKLGYDLYYVRKASPWLDLRILVGTALYFFAMIANALCKLLTLPEQREIDDRLDAELSPGEQ